MSDEMTVEEAKHVHWSTNKVCRDCLHAFFEPSCSPMKCICAIYHDGMAKRIKPKEVLFDGASCGFYEKHPNPPSYWIPGENSILDYDI